MTSCCTDLQAEVNELVSTEGLLEAVDWVHLDSRHTVAAAQLASIARGRIRVSIDVERDRWVPSGTALQLESSLTRRGPRWVVGVRLLRSDRG